MKRYLLLLFLFLLQVSHAQKEASVWYFGYNAGVDFNTGAPVVLTDGQIDVNEGCAVISDPNGNLMFYTDGITVWNRNHNPMPNGTGLKGDPSSTQSAIIVPKSDEPNIFYVFTVDDVGGPDGLQYNVVDMNLDGGMGDVTAQKNILLHTPVSEKVTAVAHSNGSAIWVVSKGWENNAYLSYRVDAAGVSTTPVVSNIGFTPTTATFINQEAQGYLKASPDGKFLATAYFSRGMAEICRFNAATGVVSDWVSLQDYLDDFWYYEKPYGVEFSPNSNILYISVQAGVLQFDISNYNQAAILASVNMISPFNSSPPFLGALQTAIDGKIYGVRGFRRYLNVINDPNVMGMGSNYQEQVVDLGTGRGVLGLPPFLTSYFHVGITAEHFCLGDATEFSVNTSDPIISITWDFGDGATSTLETPNHTYSSSGDYTISVTVQTATESKTETKDISIFETPIANPVSDFEVCTDNATYEFNLSSKDTEVLGAQSATEFQVVYFPTLADAQGNANQLPNLYTNTLATETIFARIQNVNNPDCFDTTSFDLIIQKAPIVNIQEDWTVCDTDMDGFYTFDLLEKTTSILINNDASEFTVSYYLNQVDLDNKTNPIVINYTNTLQREEVFFRIENNTYSTCYGEGTFFLEVISGVTANTPSNFEVCDDDNDGLFLFDLSTKEAEILGTQNAASSTITFHTSLLEAENGSNPINKNNYTNTIAYSQTLFTRIENVADASCYDTTSFELQVSDSPLLQTVTDWQVCDDNNDGIFSFDLNQKTTEILGSQSVSDFTVTYHPSLIDAETNQNAIIGGFDNSSNPETIFYRLENNANVDCFITGDFKLEVFNTPTAFTASPIVQCDTDESGNYSFDLSQKDMEILNGQDVATYEVSYFDNETDAIGNQNPLPTNNYINSNSEEIIYARVQHANLEACYDVTNFPLSIRSLPQPNLEEQYVICPDSPELTIDGGDFESWVWRDEQQNQISTDRILNVTSLGDFSLTVSHSPTGLTCEKNVSFEVVSSGAPEDFTTEIIGFSDVAVIEVDVTGTGDFEYGIDGENFQDSNRLEVFPGTHTVYVRDKFLCRTLSKEVIALGFQKFFTPNGDGTHEYWNILGVENFPNSQIFIFDRQGKLIAQLSPESAGWDGTFQGVQVPSSDYWFRFINEDGTIHSGHFSLKR